MPLDTANVVGSGPNGLSAAVTLAQHGVAVTVFERSERIGGACSTAEATLPGFRHDLGSSVYPLGFASPLFRSLPLEEYGLRWIEPETPCAHPLHGGRVAVLEHSLEQTAEQFEAQDARAWRNLIASSVRDFPKLVNDFTRPLLRIPSSPVAMGFFGMAALWPVQGLANTVFRSEEAKALLAGCGAHSVLPLDMLGSAATGLVLAAAAHASGWPFAAGGAQSITDALSAYLRSLGGRIETEVNVESLSQLPPADVTLFDTGAKALAKIAGDGISSSYRRSLKEFKRGPGIFKVDWALSSPIPWAARECSRAGTVHVGGTLEELARSEYAAFTGVHSDKPFVLVTQPSIFDPSRAPAGKHTAWGYCHVPVGSTWDRTDVIEAQIERFAPGFRDCILGRRGWNSEQLNEWNPNLAGGDISGGAMTLRQLVARPTLRTYRTSNPRIYLCSSSTPPGGGVHGMSGHNAAMAAWQDHA